VKKNLREGRTCQVGRTIEIIGVALEDDGLRRPPAPVHHPSSFNARSSSSCTVLATPS